MRSIPDILKQSKTIAVAGLSNRPGRASHAVVKDRRMKIAHAHSGRPA